MTATPTESPAPGAGELSEREEFEAAWGAITGLRWCERADESAQGDRLTYSEVWTRRAWLLWKTSRALLAASRATGLLMKTPESSATMVPEPGCKSCKGTGRVLLGYSGRDDDGNAPIIEQCDCFWPVSVEGMEKALAEIARLEGEVAQMRRATPEGSDAGASGAGRQEPAPLAQEAVREAPDCALCNGRGFYGTPGGQCGFCKGTGKGIPGPNWRARQSADGGADSLRGAPAAAGVPGTDLRAALVPEGNYVQPVPDHCDRITWRNHYFHLPTKYAAELVATSAASLPTLTEQRVREIAYSLPQQPWGIGSRYSDAYGFARAIEKELRATSAASLPQATEQQNNLKGD